MSNSIDVSEAKLDILWLSQQMSCPHGQTRPHDVAVDRGWLCDAGNVTERGQALALALQQQAGTRSTLRPFCTRSWT